MREKLWTNLFYSEELCRGLHLRRAAWDADFNRMGKGLYMQLNEDSSTKDIIGKFIRTHFDEIENLLENRLVFGQNYLLTYPAKAQVL